MGSVLSAVNDSSVITEFIFLNIGGVSQACIRAGFTNAGQSRV